MNHAELHNEAGKGSFDSLHVLDILQEMRTAGLGVEFIAQLMRFALEYEGLRDLMKMWIEESDIHEKEQIIADLQEVLDNIIHAPSRPEERPYLQYDDLGAVKKDIKGFKEQLRKVLGKNTRNTFSFFATYWNTASLGSLSLATTF